MGKPLKAVPQILVDDPRVADALSSIKYILDVREGRTMSDKGAMWVTFDDLTSALNKIPSQEVENNTISVSSEYEASEDIPAGLFVCIFNDNSVFKIKKACAAISETTALAPTHGYISEAATAGSKAKVYHGGMNKSYPELDALAEGTMLYLSETAGKCSATKTDTYQFIGFKVSGGVFFMPGEVNSGVKSLIKEALMETLAGTIEDGSIASILTNIKSCACLCNDAIIAQADVCTASTQVITDSAGLGANNTTAEYFDTVDGALTFLLKQRPAGAICSFNWSLKSEDPDCTGVTYGIGTIINMA